MSKIAPALDPPCDPETVTVKATRARPLTGFIPIAWGAKGTGVPTVVSADGKVSRAVTCSVVRFTTARVGLGALLFATRAKLRMLSTATPTGALAGQVEVSVGVRVAPTVPVQIKPDAAGGDRFRLTNVMSFEF